VCVGSDPVVCPAADVCHDAGVCAPSTGLCEARLKSTCAPATLVAAETFHDFGGVAIATGSAPYTFRVTNSGDVSTGVLTGAVVGPDSGHFIISNACAETTLAPGAACDVTVAFAPTTTGQSTAGVVLSGGGTSGSLVLSVTGTALNPAQLALSPAGTIDLGSVAVGETSIGQVFALSNADGQATTGPITIAISDTENFTLTTGGSPACNLAPGGMTLGARMSCMFRVRFNPKAAGPISAQLSVVATPGGAQSVQLVGRGL
jgi:hypothetical protein